MSVAHTIYSVASHAAFLDSPVSAAGEHKPGGLAFIRAVAAVFQAIFTNSWFLLVGVPLVVAFMAIWLRWSARPADKKALERVDFLIGFDLGIIAIVTMLSVTAKAAAEVRSLNTQLAAAVAAAAPDRASHLAEQVQSAVAFAVAAPLFVIFYALALIGTSNLVSRKGWSSGGELSNAWIVGVDAFGFFLLVATLLMTGEVT
jgi:hypothetical protein